MIPSVGPNRSSPRKFRLMNPKKFSNQCFPKPENDQFSSASSLHWIKAMAVFKIRGQSKSSANVTATVVLEWNHCDTPGACGNEATGSNEIRVHRANWPFQAVPGGRDDDSGELSPEVTRTTNTSPPSDSVPRYIWSN
jgi:hypothetical protein